MREIRNCEFKFKCPIKWEALEPTDHQDQRYCGQCNRIVYFCKTGKQLMAAIKADHCVAIVNTAKDEGLLIVGMMESRYDDDLVRRRSMSRVDFWLELPTRDFIQALKTVKPKLKSAAKKAGTLDISFINGEAVFCVGGAMTRVAVKGHWAGLVETPFLTLLSFIQVPPVGDTVTLEFDGEKFKIGSFRCKATWQNLSIQFAEIKNEIHLNELDKKADQKKHYCPNCGTKTGIPQPETPTDLFEGLSSDPRPITRYQCNKCRLGWSEEGGST